MPPIKNCSPPERLRSKFVLAALCLGIFCSGPVAAQTDPEAVIPTDPAVSDSAMEERLREIYAQVEGWEGISATVESGVVTLKGEVLESRVAEEAASLAERLAGVVLVRNQIGITGDLRHRLDPVQERIWERIYNFVTLAPLLVVALVIMAVAVWLSRFARSGKWLERRFTNPFLADIAKQAVRGVILLLGLLLSLELLNATALVGAVLGTAGVAGIAIGFAFKDLVENYIASILLSLRQPFAPNDHVVLDGNEGRVVRLTSRATILLTPEGNHLRIPNATVFKSTILNYTTNPKRRFDFAVGVGTEDEISVARELGIEALTTLDSVEKEPAPSSVVETLGDSNVVVRFFGWIDQRTYDFLKVRSAALVAVKAVLDDAGIEMPEPIFRVRTETLTKSASPTKLKADVPEPATEEDVAADLDIQRQVEAEREAGGEDLLSVHAPQE